VRIQRCQLIHLASLFQKKKNSANLFERNRWISLRACDKP
jgi:hypothetical protein